MRECEHACRDATTPTLNSFVADQSCAESSCVLLPEEFDVLRTLVGEHPSFLVNLDVNVTPLPGYQGVSLPKSLSYKQFMQMDSIQGQHVWLCPPASDVSHTLKWYQRLKRASPHNVSACIFVPRWLNQRWRNSLVHMQQLKVYSKGDSLFLGQRLPYDMEVWYDPVQPVVTAALSPGRLGMRFQAQVSGQSMGVLMDTGASEEFISAAAVAHLGLKLTPNVHRVSLGDGSNADTQGTCTVSLRIQGYRSKVRMHVLPALPAGYDVILGDQWLTAHHAVLDYGRSLCIVRCGKSSHVLKADAGVQGSRLSHPERSGGPKVLSAMQLKRVVNGAAASGDMVFLAVVREKVSEMRSQGTDPGLCDLLDEFADVFPDALPGLPPVRDVAHTITLQPGANPPNRPLYRLSPKELEEVRKTVADLLGKGLIQPSTSPFGAPVIFVQKKDGSLRMCMDYRALNKLTMRNAYPLPRIDDLLDRLHGVTLVSSLDLQSGYHQIRLHESETPMTAFKTPMGLYEFKVLPFGLCNAPATFQAAMNSVLGPLIAQNKALVYLDDVLVLGRCKASHLQNLREVLECLRKHHFYAKLSKCEFMREELCYLGHIVGKHGIRVDPAKVAVIQQWPRPHNVQALRSFLGLANYFRRFMRNYAAHTSPLTGLTGGPAVWVYNDREDNSWPPECERAFQWVKDALASAPTLVPPDFGKDFTVTVDASGTGIGAVLEQDGRPVAFESRKLTPAERNYTTTEQEMLAVVHALRVWRCYLESGKPFLIKTDHKPNTYFDSKPSLSRREARWVEFLAQFTYAWEYKAGKENVVADSLSRLHAGPVLAGLRVTLAVTTRSAVKAAAPSQVPAAELPPVLAAEVAPVPPAAAVRPSGALPSPGVARVQPGVAMPAGRSRSFLDRVRAGYPDDPFYADIPEQRRELADTGLEFRGGFWWRGGQVAVPNFPAYTETILDEMHDSPVAGHMGIEKTLKAVTSLWWWPTVRRDVMEWVKTCDACQRNKGDLRKRGLLQPIKPARKAWDKVSCDLITDLPETPSGHTAIFVVVDMLTKMAHFVPTVTALNTEGLARLFVREVWRLHGLPQEIISDRDPRFTGHFTREVCRLIGTKQSMSTAFHPQSDGQTERVNRILEDMLRHYVAPDQSDWDRHLDAAEFAYNNAWHASVQETPFMLNYGQHPNTPLRMLISDNGKVPAADAFVAHIRDGVARARECLLKAQQRYASYANRSRQDVEFEVGKLVMLHTKNIRMAGTRKLLPRWLGPFRIERKVGPVAYELALPSAMGKLHRVFHVGLLKPYFADATRVTFQPLIPKLSDEQGPVMEVDRVLDHRDVTVTRGGKKRGKHTRTVREYLVSWQGFDAADATWEPEDNLMEQAEAMLLTYRKSIGKVLPS